ncbi:hypothetical protein KKF60_00065 [Patescibacteria group bacterium]|nr:hypothetical protein [Patescibacteria group bacterium]MBU4458297.1 hypothetical protein [Patescibacteria group bacterium]MCG2696212.1 hypothetical protein [Candidatus Portnoybacteria bacterium]
MQELFKKLKEFNLQKWKFAIFGSGPMGIIGIREIEDLDVIVAEDIFNDFSKRPDFELGKKESGIEYLEKNGIEFYKNWHPGDWDINKLIQEAEIIDDLPFVKLEEVLKWKKLYNREKDKKDIELIENYLSQKQ